MWRPATRNLLILSCGVCLSVASGCSLFRSPVNELLVTEPPLSAFQEAAFAPPSPAEAPAQANRPTSGETSATTKMPAAADAPVEPEPASCYVEIRALGKEPKRLRMSLDDANYVQTVLEQTGVAKKFRNMDIELSRKLSDGTRHKLTVHYDAKRKRVVSAFDYALHPDDLLVIRQGTLTSFDEMMKKLAGPLAL